MAWGDHTPSAHLGSLGVTLWVRTVGQSPGAASSKRDAKTRCTLDNKMQRGTMTARQTARI